LCASTTAILIGLVSDAGEAGGADADPAAVEADVVEADVADDDPVLLPGVEHAWLRARTAHTGTASNNL
ncbi:MAG: hypothetical protein ACREMY_18355, partial [bacterium]